MGNQLGPELDAAKKIVADFSVKFSVNYIKMYTIALMKEQKKQQLKEAAGPKWKLLKCSKDIPQPPIKTGIVKKLSKHLKNWNPRYVIVKGNYLIDYYESEEKFKAGAKPLGSINMSNLNVNRDANDTILNRLIDLCKKANLDIESVPKPAKYPDYTIELFHERKDPIYIQCADEADWKSWYELFEKCRYYAPRYDVQDDRAHLWAFPIALWRTRWECDMWGWWWGGGGEVSMISDAINDKVASEVMGSVDSKLRMPWMARVRARNSFIKAVDGVTTSAVKPMWSTAYETVKKARPTVEEQLKSLMGPINEAQNEVNKSIVDMVETQAKGTVESDIAPKLQPLIELLFAPVIEASKGALLAYDAALAKGKADYKSHEKHMGLVNKFNWISEIRDAQRRVWDMYDPLWNMRTVFDDVSPWGIVGRAQRRVQKLLNNALFTFETNYEKEKENGKSWDDVAQETRVLLVEDIRQAITRVLSRILFEVVENFWEKTVIRLSRKLVAPLSEKVPQAVKDFVDPDDMLEQILYNVLRACCSMLVTPFASRIQL